MRAIKESDWKCLRELRPLALERLCARILQEVAQASSTSQSYHQRYLQVFSLVQEGDREVAAMFDDVRRSNALGHLALMRKHGLISDDEFSGFSEETRDLLNRWYPAQEH